MTFEAYGPYSDTILVLSPEIAWASELKMSDQKMTNEKVGPLPANCSGLANPVFQSGTTLIELSIVIAVLLLLVGVLFIGITAWKSGAKQSGMHSEFLEYSKVRSRIPKPGRAQYRGNAYGRYYDNRWLLGDGASLSGRGYIHAFEYGAFCWSRCMTCSTSGHAPSTTTVANW